MEKVSKALVGVAGVHWVVTKLSWRGIIALPTVRNTAGVDVLCTNKDGSKIALLQVKSSRRKASYWPTPKGDAILSGKNCYYVFLRYTHDIDDFEAFLVPGREVKEQVAENEKGYREKGLKEFTFFSLEADNAPIYKKNWEEFSM